MEEDEELDTTNETENVDTETTEENQEGNTENLDLDNQNEEGNEQNNEETKSEEPVKTFTQEQLDAIIAERVRRERNTYKRSESDIRKEYEDKLANIENVVKAGFGTENLDEGINKITEICKTKGIEIPKIQNTAYSQSDLEVLANHAADEIKEDGYEAIDAELKRLAYKGVDRMTAKEKIVFSKLNDTKKVLDGEKELEKIGVKREILDSKEFKDFANKFAGSQFSMTEVYKMYSSVQNETKPKAKPLGSMTNNNPKEPKTFISEAEYDKMTDAEIEKNMTVIRNSMSKW